MKPAVPAPLLSTTTAAQDGPVESRIYACVFDSVMDQRLPPGTKLPEAALCDLFQGNPVLERFPIELVSRCSLIVALYEWPGNASCEHDEHEALVDCLESRDEEGAARIMEEHLLVLERHIRLQQESPAGGLARMLGLA
jgi:DNA-binding GntR family transcriptional regulator